MAAFQNDGTMKGLRTLMGLGSSVNSFSSFFSHINIWSKAKPKNSSYSEGIDAASAYSLTTIAQFYDNNLQGWGLAALPSSQEKLSAFIGYDHAIGTPASGLTVDATHADTSSGGYFTVQVTFYQTSSNQVSIPDVVGSGCKMGVYCVKVGGGSTHDSSVERETIGSYGSVTVAIPTTNWDTGQWRVYPYICNSAGTVFYTIPNVTSSIITVTQYVPPQPELKSIFITGYNGAINVGDTLSLTVWAHYDDGNGNTYDEDVTSEIPANSWSGFGNSFTWLDYGVYRANDGGTFYINVTYMGETLLNDLTVVVDVAKTLVSISISNLPSSVNVNTDFEPTVTAHWSDNTISYVTSYASWSGYSSIASLNGTTFRGHTGGTATFTASYTSGGVTRTAYQSVTVVALDYIIITGYYRPVAINDNNNNKVTLQVVAFYTDNSHSTVTTSVTWGGTYNSYFTRGGNDGNEFTGNAVGECTITASYRENGITRGDSITAKCIKRITEIRIREYPSTSIADNPINMITGDVITLYAGILPSDATIKTLSWSGGSGVFTIGDKYQAGNHNVHDITATGSGSGTLTVAATDGYGVTETRTINVSLPPVAVTNAYIYYNNVDKSGTTISISEGDSIILSAMYAPNDATIASYRWQSSARGYVTVDDGTERNATINGIQAGGQSIVTLKITDTLGNEKTNTVTIIVTNPR